MKAKREVKFAAVVVLAAVALSAAGKPAVTGVTAQQRYPWNGKFDISWTASGLDALSRDHDRPVAMKVFAVDQTTHVTNFAASACLSGDTSTSDGTHAFVWDMDAQGIFQGTVSTNFEVFVVVEPTKPLGGVQFWENGPYWAECNVGATKAEDYGYYFMLGDTNGYVRSANDDGWVSARDGSTLSGGFCAENCETYTKNFATLVSEGVIDPATSNITEKCDAATHHWGNPWRMQTKEEMYELNKNCTYKWITTNGVSGALFTGKGAYATNSIFFPANGYGWQTELKFRDTYCYYWQSTLDGVYTSSTWTMYVAADIRGYIGFSNRDGLPIRPVRGEAVYSGRSGAVRADLRTGKMRTAATTEGLTYSTAWDGGETATIKANDETLSEAAGGGIYEWKPTLGRVYSLTHTVETNSVPVVLKAYFSAPCQMGEDAWALVEDGACAVYGSGDMWDADEWPAGNPLENYRTAITNVSILAKVRSVGAQVFQDFPNLSRISCAESVTNVDEKAFEVQAVINMDGDVPEISAIPEVSINGKSTHVMGKKDLGDDKEDWTDVTSMTAEEKRQYHFFQVVIK